MFRLAPSARFSHPKDPNPMVATSGEPSAIAARHLEINAERLWQEIMETSRFGGIPGTMGITRLALSKSDQAVRDLFISRAQQIGCSVKVDQIGNIFAILPGQDNSLAPIGMGSHLDTQPKGGKFDGILGVLGALEVLRTVRENHIVTLRPLAAICWSNEEGATFQSGCTGSAVWSGYHTLEQGYALKTIDEDSTFGAELKKIGYQGSTPADYRQNPLAAHFEVHIEQGPRLEEERKRIGVVTGIQGNCRLRVEVEGQKCHAGSTPMDVRADALVASARMVLRVEGAGIENDGFATVGWLMNKDGSTNCVPGKVVFTVDLRNPHSDRLDRMEQSVMAELKRIQSENPKIGVQVSKVWTSPAANLSDSIVDCVRESAIQRCGRSAVMELGSFAGHDSAMINLQVPTAMIFVPSRKGISHSPEEYSSKEQCADGVQVLMNAVLVCDERL